MLLLIGYSFVELGPGWPVDGLVLLVRIVAAGTAVALWYTALGLVASSLTDRRAFASAGIVLAALVSAAAVGTLVEGADLSPWLRVADLFNLPFEVVRRLYGEEGEYSRAGHRAAARRLRRPGGRRRHLRAQRYQRMVVTR